MALEVTQRLVCDICHKAEGLTRWTVRSVEQRRAVTADLCEEHAEVLVDLFARFPKGKRGKQARVHAVVSEAEIERRAAARKRTTKKRSR